MNTDDIFLKEIFDEIDKKNEMKENELKRLQKLENEASIMLDTYKVLPGEKDLLKRLAYLITVKAVTPFLLHKES